MHSAVRVRRFLRHSDFGNPWFLPACETVDVNRVGYKGDGHEESDNECAVALLENGAVGVRAGGLGPDETVLQDGRIRFGLGEGDVSFVKSSLSLIMG